MVSALFLSSLLGVTLAQTTVLNFTMLGFEDMPLVASVVSANAKATTLQIACVDGTDSEDCGLFPKETLVVGPSTFNIDMSDPNTDFTATMDCVIASGAVCKETAGGSEANFPGSSTETYDATDVATVAVTITAGAEKLSGSAEPTASGSSSKASVSASASASASAGSGASKIASATKVTGTPSATESMSVSQTKSAASTTATGAAAAHTVVLGGGLVGAAAGLLGGLLL